MTTVQTTKGLEGLSNFVSLMKEHGLTLEDITNSQNMVRQADIDQMLNEGAQLEASMDPKFVKATKVSIEEFKKTLEHYIIKEKEERPYIVKEKLTFETVSAKEIESMMENAGQKNKKDVIISPAAFSPEVLTDKIHASRETKPVNTNSKKAKIK